MVDIWQHPCATMPGTEGWFEYRVSITPREIAPDPQEMFKLRGRQFAFLGSIATKEQTFYFVRYLFEDRLDFVEFRLRHMTAEALK